jgi:hypothetical protein
VFGNIESSGTFPLEAIGENLINKHAPIDAVILVRDVLGYVFWCDADGAAHFDSGNLHQPGNFLLTGGHTPLIPTVDERVQLFSYSEGRPSGNLYSEIVLARYDTEAGFTDNVVTHHTPTTAALTRGLVKPGLIGVDVSMTADEQLVMAKLIDKQIGIKARRGTLQMWGNPLFNPSDQVRVYERQTGVTDVQYIRSLRSAIDRKSGKYTQDLELSWLGDPAAWPFWRTVAKGVVNTVHMSDSVASTVVQSVTDAVGMSDSHSVVIS